MYLIYIYDVEMKFIVIGIDDNKEQHFSQEVTAVIQSHAVFSGGRRHAEIVRDLLPPQAEWIMVELPLQQLFSRYQAYTEIVVFASGDPLFFGLANTIRRMMPQAEVVVFPYFNSLQQLAHRMLMPYQDMKIVSLTGRPWDKFDEALIAGEEKIGVLTDNKLHTPAHIAKRMLEFGYDNYRMTVGELLGNKDEERVTELWLDQVVKKNFAFPNNLILEKTGARARPFGIPESDFHLLNGRAKMITKMPVRLLTLSQLDLRERDVLWDVGFCTGSVSIEAKLQFPHLHVVAFEQRPEGEALIYNNARKFGTPGIEAIIGDFAQVELDALPAPDAVFIGGYGGKMHKIVACVVDVLNSGGVLVFNSVSEESRLLFLDAIAKYGLKLVGQVALKVDDFNTIEVLKAIKR